MLKNKNREKPVKNRNKLIDLLICLILAGGLILGLALDIVHDRTNYRVEFYQLSSKRISGSLRIVFLTDLHRREYGEGNSELAEDIESLSPDLILLGGDMVIDSVSDYDGMLSLCSRLSETAPIYGVLGNHEDVKIYLQKDSELLGAFEAAGVHLLINDTAQVKIGENTVTLIGLDGKPADFERYGGEEAMERSEKESLGYRICMAHVPTYFPERLAEYSFDLGLAGHTHGGIINLPKLGPLYSAEEGLLPEYAKGEYTLSNGAPLIVSGGLGDSRDLLPRINNTPELTVIDIT